VTDAARMAGSDGEPGDGDAFAARLAEELPRLVRLATRLVGDSDVAEDCAQETIVGV
jgi:DNA-directed RNA polymerase specialized sigma24 family protein